MVYRIVINITWITICMPDITIGWLIKRMKTARDRIAVISFMLTRRMNLVLSRR